MTRLVPRILAALFTAAMAAGAEKVVTTISAASDSSIWSALLARHVDSNGLIDYARWKQDAADRQSLKDYLAKFNAAPGHPPDDQKTALLINAYNAFIIEAVLDHYPVASVRSIRGVFTEESHAIGGVKYSLDEIEHTTVRLAGYRAHAAMVCASRSCPPLDRKAYEADDLTAHLDARMRVWMSLRDRYQFDPAKNVARLSRYFDWYKLDFEIEGIPKVLARFAPAQYRDWLAKGSFRIEYLEYDWALNDRLPAMSENR